MDADRVYVQERTITLPLAGETTLLVFRATPKTFRTIDMIEERVRQYEDFMNVAYPFKTLPAFIAYNDVVRGYFGPVGFLTFAPEYQEDEYLIAHEVAHSYWHTGIERETAVVDGVGLKPFNWIDEGAATFMNELALDRLQSFTLPSDTGCSLFETIGEIDQMVFFDPDELIRGNLLYKSGCNYTMGYGIFSALYHRLGDEEFRRSFGSLYLKMHNLEHEDQCVGVETGICYVQKAFVEEASPGFAEAAGEVIDRWYYGPSESDTTSN